MEKYRWSNQESLDDLLAAVVMQFVEEKFVNTELFTATGPDGTEWNVVAYDDEAPIEPGFKERFLDGLYKEFHCGVNLGEGRG